MYLKVRKTVGITNLPERPSWKNTLVPILWTYCSSILWALRGICSKYIHEFECFRSSRGTNYSFPECTCIFLTVKKGKLFFWRKKENSPAFKIFSFLHQRGSIFFSFQQFHFRYNLTIVSWIWEMGSNVGDILNFMDLMYTL